MGVYVLTDGAGSYIRHDELTGKYVPIRNFKQAQQWDSQQKANSVLNNSVAKSIRSNYAVNLIDTEHIVEKDDMSKQQELCFRTLEDSNIEEWLNKINIVIEDYILNVQYQTEEHTTTVVKDILENWVTLSHNSKFHAIFATSSIPEAINYYRMIKEMKPELKVTALFDPNINK